MISHARAASALAALTITLATSTLAASVAHAQTTRADVDERFSLEREAHDGGVFVGCGAGLLGVAAAGYLGSSIAGAENASFWEGSQEGMWIVFGAIAAGGLGLLITGLVLQADASGRRDRLERRAQSSLAWSLAPRPGGGTLGATLRW